MRRADGESLRRSFRMGELGGQLFTLKREEYGYKIKELLRRLTSRRTEAEAEAEAVLGGRGKRRGPKRRERMTRGLFSV